MDIEGNNIHEMIRERFARLPQKLQEAIMSADVPEKLRAIAGKHRLHLDQGQLLENETHLVMLGLDQAEKFRDNIQKELGIPENVAHEIAEEVGKEIFLPIRTYLQAATGAPAEKKEGASSLLNASSPAADSRLTGMVRNVSKNISLGDEPTAPAPQGNRSLADPYREPIE